MGRLLALMVVLAAAVQEAAVLVGPGLRGRAIMVPLVPVVLVAAAVVLVPLGLLAMAALALHHPLPALR